MLGRTGKNRTLPEPEQSELYDEDIFGEARRDFANENYHD